MALRIGLSFLVSSLCFPPIQDVAAAANLLQSYPTLCDPIDGSPPGSSVPGILQARILEWVAISFSNAWKWKVKVKSLSRVWLFATPWTVAYHAPPSMGFSMPEYWSGVPLPSPSNPGFFLVFPNLDNFCRVRASYFEECPSVWSCVMFSHNTYHFFFWEKNTLKVPFSGYHLINSKQVMSSLMIGDDFYHLIKMDLLSSAEKCLFFSSIP